MIGLTAVVYSCFQIVSCWAYYMRVVYLFGGKLLLTFFIQRLQTFFIYVTFYVFNVFLFWGNVFSSMLGGTFTNGLYGPRKGDDLPACNRAKSMAPFILPQSVAN